MREGSFAVLDDRGVVRIGGTDAQPFLQDILTTDMVRVAAEGTGFGALLSPQGKILVDFLVRTDAGGFLFDLPRASIADFLRRMTLYRLRAKVEIADLSASHKVVVYWGADAPPAGIAVVADSRAGALGWRAILDNEADPASTGFAEQPAAAWQAARIAAGVPEAGRDFAFGDAFPHDADMDDLGGLDFRKGCYVGQEIVSRMEHRGTARRRAVMVAAGADLPQPGTPVEAGGRALGTLGSADGGKGLALLRLDRTKQALDAGLVPMAAGVPIDIALPPFARFTWPAAAEDEGAA